MFIVNYSQPILFSHRPSLNGVILITSPSLPVFQVLLSRRNQMNVHSLCYRWEASIDCSGNTFFSIIPSSLHSTKYLLTTKICIRAAIASVSTWNTRRSSWYLGAFERTSLIHEHCIVGLKRARKINKNFGCLMYTMIYSSQLCVSYTCTVQFI